MIKKIGKQPSLKLKSAQSHCVNVVTNQPLKLKSAQSHFCSLRQHGPGSSLGDLAPGAPRKA